MKYFEMFCIQNCVIRTLLRLYKVIIEVYEKDLITLRLCMVVLRKYGWKSVHNFMYFCYFVSVVA